MPSPSPKSSTLATYEFNIRSFHPLKSFGWSGFDFSGDNRGFSLRPNNKNTTSSRIWHNFRLNTATGAVIPKTGSHPSKAPPSLVSTGKEVDYDKDPHLGPTHLILPVLKGKNASVNPVFRIQGYYSGINYGMRGSQTMKEWTGSTYVPSLDVRYRLKVEVDRVAKQLTVTAYVTGNGFPNCEAFIVDPKGKAVFLGTHVRAGLAPTMLPTNLDMPMRAAKIWLSLDDSGNFSGLLRDELQRLLQGNAWSMETTLDAWNQSHLNKNPNAGRTPCAGWSGVLRELCFHD